MKSYYQIRETCLLVSYSHKLAAGGSLWVEHYVDEYREYFALFGETSDSPLPITITSITLE